MKVFEASFLRRELNLSEECQADLEILESDLDLSKSLQESVQSFHVELASNRREYCDTRRTTKNGDEGALITTHTSCIIDYTKFSKGYQNKCKNTPNAVQMPISLLMECSTSSSDFAVDMQFINLPICLGQSCDANEVVSALDLALKSSSSSLKENGGEMVRCEIYSSFDFEPTYPIKDNTDKSSSKNKGDVKDANTGDTNTLQAIPCDSSGCDQMNDYSSSAGTIDMRLAVSLLGTILGIVLSIY